VTLRKGDETGCGMNEGMLPPLLLGGVTKELVELRVGMDEGEGEDDLVGVLQEGFDDAKDGRKEVGRGIDDGEETRGIALGLRSGEETL